MKTILLALCVALSLPGPVGAIKCHICVSAYQPSCRGQYVDQLPLYDCPTGDTYCRKTSVGGKVVLRSCESVCTGCDNIVTTTHCCTTDGCNAATMTSFNSIVIMASIITGIWFSTGTSSIQYRD